MSLSDSAVISLQNKSTIVRSRPLPVPSWVRAGFQLTSAVSDGAASLLGRRLFFSPPRTHPTPDEEVVVQSGQSFHLTVGRDLVRGHTWGDGPAVLLVHGWGGNAGHMTAFVKPLVEAGFRAIAIDMPAHGASQGRLSSIVHFERTLVQARALFGSIRAVVTHSFGGAACAFAFSRGLSVQRAVFVSPPARFDDFWGRFREALGVNDAVWQRMTHDAQAWLDLQFDDLQAEKLAPRMETPLLVMHDVGNREILVENGETLAALWPGAQFHRTHGLGHRRILRDEDVVARAVAFVAG